MGVVLAVFIIKVVVVNGARGVLVNGKGSHGGWRRGCVGRQVRREGFEKTTRSGGVEEEEKCRPQR